MSSGCCENSSGQLIALITRHHVDPYPRPFSEDITAALSRLTEPTVAYTLPSLGTVVTKATKKLQIREEEAPIPAEMLNEILLVSENNKMKRVKCAKDSSCPATVTKTAFPSQEKRNAICRTPRSDMCDVSLL